MGSMRAVNLCDCVSDAAARLPDDRLISELLCAQKCALMATRTRREAALLRARCLRLELERRKLAASQTIVTAREPAAV
jgi:hypothetical protein